MFGFSHQSDKAMPSPHFFQKFEQQIAPAGGAQDGQSAVTTAGDKVQIAGALVTLETAGHAKSVEQWTLRSL